MNALHASRFHALQTLHYLGGSEDLDLCCELPATRYGRMPTSRSHNVFNNTKGQAGVAPERKNSSYPISFFPSGFTVSRMSFVPSMCASTMPTRSFLPPRSKKAWVPTVVSNARILRRLWYASPCKSSRPSSLVQLGHSDA